MAVKLFSGKTKTMYFPRPASQAFTAGTLVYVNPDDSGTVIPADATSGRLVGVIKKTVATTDADYASSGVLVPVEVPIEDYVEWLIDTTGAVAADILDEIDLTDAATADRSASAKDALLVTRVISATKIAVVILSKATNRYTATT